jgi:nucleotide-binding universal stress UspA family protein
MKILVAVDGSPYTRRMLAYLAAHDEWLGAHHEYTLLHVVPAIPHRAAAVLDKAAVKAFHEAAVDKVFKPLRTFFTRQGLKASYVAKIGPAADLIAEYARKGQFDLVMLGSHGHGTLKNLVMGSVATKVMAHCDTPALVIR